ncbi:MAG: hypothetical protein ACFB6S_19080 [Geminicoccaceae bacterium]
MTRVLLMGLCVLVLGTGLFLVTWDLNVPTTRVEKVIPNDSLPQ